MSDDADKSWSDTLGAMIADELAMGGLLAPERLARAAEIAAQQIYICLVSGFRPENSDPPHKPR